MRIHHYPLKSGITRTPEFERKGLATHAINVGTKCGHGCLYCSTGALLRMHPSFKACGENPFEFGYAIVDPTTPERVAVDAKRLKDRGLIQLCTTTDSWSPEAHEYRLGKQCLEAILNEPQWDVRILTKNASVKEDFSLIRQFRDRVQVGLSITSTPEKSEVIKIIEPNASDIEERMAAMRLAAAMGLRTYGMLCPLLPGIADSPEQVDQSVQFAVECNAEEIFAEPVNPRGNGLRLCQEALELWGYDREAQAIKSTRNRKAWSHYVVALVKNVQSSVRKYSKISKLRFLLYPKGLTESDLVEINKDDEGIVWL
ncbi:radical SAM protein [Planctomycetota bacterium]